MHKYRRPRTQTQETLELLLLLQDLQLLQDLRVGITGALGVLTFVCLSEFFQKRQKAEAWSLRPSSAKRSWGLHRVDPVGALNTKG